MYVHLRRLSFLCGEGLVCCYLFGLLSSFLEHGFMTCVFTALYFLSNFTLQLIILDSWSLSVYAYVFLYQDFCFYTSHKVIIVISTICSH